MKKSRLLTLGILLLILILPGLAFSQSASQICIPKQALDGLISDSQERDLLRDVYSSEKTITSTLSKQLVYYRQRVVADSLVTSGFVDITKQQRNKLTELDLKAARDNTTIKNLSTQRNVLVGTTLSLLAITLLLTR